jgi:putative chitinase
MIPTGVGQIVSAMKAIGCKNAEATNSLMDVYPKVNDILARESIQNTDLWWSHVIPQIGHESGLFSKTEENLNYRAARLIEVWPRHFKTLASAAPFAHNPEALAERIYGIDNPSIAKNLGNTKAGDGWAFRGRGWPQMTGRYNYTTSGAYLGIDFLLNPDLARYPKIAWLTTAWFMTRPSMKAAINKDDVV